MKLLTGAVVMVQQYGLEGIILKGSSIGIHFHIRTQQTLTNAQAVTEKGNIPWGTNRGRSSIYKLTAELKDDRDE
jgi:hypothetical protein